MGIPRFTFMSYGWTNGKGMTLLNFLVKCPKGAILIKFIDAFPHVKDTTLFCNLLEEFNWEVDEEHVVQVITGNVVDYVETGKILMDKHPHCLRLHCCTLH